MLIRRRGARALGLAVFAFAAVAGMQPPAAMAQGTRAAAAVAHAQPPQSAADSQAAPKVADTYYVELRARLAISYGHSYVVFGRGSAPPKKITANQVAGL